MKKNKIGTVVAKLLPPIIAILLILLVWQLLSVSKILPSYMMPSPKRVFTALIEDFDILCQHGGVAGLGILKGCVRRFSENTEYKIPQIGWNSIEIAPSSRLFEGIDNQSYVYFVHSYYLEAEDESVVAATCEYANHFHAAVEKDNVFACQFHPEKSSDTGLKILQNFANL